MQKIGILTYHASHNYGSMLQAYALQTFLPRQGFDVRIINLRVCAQSFMYIHPLMYMTYRKARTILFHPSVIISNIKKWHAFENFIKENYRLTRECHQVSELLQVIKEEKFDTIITGGDQIWNMNCLDFNISYYLPFELENVRKVSYSPSFGDGTTWNPATMSSLLKHLLQGYDSISVRDAAGSLFLSELMGFKVPQMPDPTFLLSKGEYEELAGDEPLVKGKYIFYYHPYANEKIERFAMDYAEKTGIKIVTSIGEYNQCKGMKRYQATGPKEFLNLIRYADIVCGYSFHMVVFCMILQKDFFVISNHKDNRISGLLEAVDMSDFIYYTNDTKLRKVTSKVSNWNKIASLLSEYKKIGDDYLKESLK